MDGERTILGTGGCVSSTLSSIEAIRERERRFSHLREAWHALTPAVDGYCADAGQGLAQDLRAQLGRLVEQVELAAAASPGGEAATGKAWALRKASFLLDADLERYAALLCLALETTEPSQLYANLPTLDAAGREGVTALLEFVLEQETYRDARVATVGHLATLLSTEERQGRRRVTRDPATLTPRIQCLSEQIEAESTLDLRAIEAEFIDAARRCEEGATDDLAREMRERMAEVGCAILAPQVLRSVVFFNSAVQSVSRAGGADPGSRARADSTVALDPEPGAPALAASKEGPEVRWSIPKKALPASRTPARANGRGERPRFLRLVAAGAGLAAVAGIVGSVWTGSSEGTVRVFSKDDLGTISSRLDSGYRDRLGFGPLFVGRVKAGWGQLAPAERASSADEISARLGQEGVREILLYDEDGRVAVHFAEALPLRIGP